MVVYFICSPFFFFLRCAALTMFPTQNELSFAALKCHKNEMVNLSAVLRVVRPNEFFLVFHVQCCRSCIHVHTILIFAILFLLKTLWKQFHFSLKIWLHTLYGMDRVHIIQLTSIVLLTKKRQLFSENIKKRLSQRLGDESKKMRQNRVLRRNELIDYVWKIGVVMKTIWLQSQSHTEIQSDK